MSSTFLLSSLRFFIFENTFSVLMSLHHCPAVLIFGSSINTIIIQSSLLFGSRFSDPLPFAAEKFESLKIHNSLIYIQHNSGFIAIILLIYAIVYFVVLPSKLSLSTVLSFLFFSFYSSYEQSFFV